MRPGSNIRRFSVFGTTGQRPPHPTNGCGQSCDQTPTSLRLSHQFRWGARNWGDLTAGGGAGGGYPAAAIQSKRSQQFFDGKLQTRSHLASLFAYWRCSFPHPRVLRCSRGNIEDCFLYSPWSFSGVRAGQTNMQPPHRAGSIGLCPTTR